LGFLGWIYLVCHSFSYFNIGGEIAYNGDYNSLISALDRWPQDRPLPIILFRRFTSSLPPPPFRRGLIPRKRPISDGGWCVILAFIESDLTRDLLNQPAQPRYMLWALEDQDNISGLLRENGVRGLRGHLGAIIEALELSDRLTRWLRGGVGWAAGPKPDIRLEDFILGFEPKWRRKPLKPSDTPSMLV